MISLFVLALLLLTAWLWAVLQREGRASFMRDWVHVPFIGCVICVIMAVGLWIR